MAKVSAIIPVYNCEHYIEETVQSVLAQTYKDIEVIVVDDGSSDRTREILKNFGSRIDYIRQSKNTGPSIARNRGIEQARGEYIAFLDHDDVWAPNKIEEQIKLLESNKDLALVYSNCYNVEQSDLVIGTLFDITRPHRGFVFENLLLDNFIPTSSVVLKRRVLNEVGTFNGSFLIGQDFDLYLRIAERYEIDFVNFPLLKHRVYPGSASSRKRKIGLDEAIYITKFYRDKVAFKNPRLAKKLDRRIAKYMFYIAIWSLEHENREEALKRYFDCIKTASLDYKIALGFIFFITPKFISIPLVKKVVRIQGVG